MGSVTLEQLSSVLMSQLSRYDETGDMRSFSLMFLFMIVYCSLVSSEDTISISNRRNDRFRLNPSDRFSDASTSRRLESHHGDDWKFYHPDDLKLLNSRWNKHQNIIPELQISKGQHRPITKIVEELFPGFKSTTPQSAKKPNKQLATTNDKKEGASNDRVKPAKPFWGPSVLISSVRPWFYTTQASRKVPYTKEETTSGVGIPLDKREPSNPFWGPAIGTSSTWPPPHTKTTTATILTQEEEEFLFHSTNETDTEEGNSFSRPIAEALRQSYELPYNQQIVPEQFREQVHLKPGPPYHEKQEENDFINQDVWHAGAFTEPTIVGDPISTEPHFPKQQLEPEIAVQQPHYPGLAPNLEVSHLPKEIDTTALASYPSSYPHSKPKPHIIYHHQPAPQHYNYYRPSGLTHVDFSPIFLAIVPIALFLGAAAAFALASAVSSSSAVATAQQQQQQQEESNSNNNNDNNNNNNNINTILALLAAFHEVKKHHDDNKIVIITTTTTTTTESNVKLADEVPVTTVPPLLPPPPTGPFFIKLSPSTTEFPPVPSLPYGHYERKKITYHYMNGIT